MDTNTTTAPLTTTNGFHTIDLPTKFYDDHVGRDCLHGVFVKKSGNSTRVRITDEALADVLCDARHYVEEGQSGGALAGETGLVASARATVKRIEQYLRFTGQTLDGRFPQYAIPESAPVAEVAAQLAEPVADEVPAAEVPAAEVPAADEPAEVESEPQVEAETEPEAEPAPAPAAPARGGEKHTHCPECGYEFREARARCASRPACAKRVAAKEAAVGE